MENHYPYLMFNTNKISNEDSSDSEKVKDKHFKFQNFMKFKPKKKMNEEQEKNSLKGAEFKVKSLLSDYIKNIHKEKKNENKQLKFPKFSNFYRKGKKRYTEITTIFPRTKKVLRTEIEKKNSPKKNKNNVSPLIVIHKKRTKRKYTCDNIFEYNDNSFHNKTLKSKEKKSDENQSNKSKHSPLKKYTNEDKLLNKDSMKRSQINNRKSINSLFNWNPINKNLSLKNEKNNNHKKDDFLDKIIERKNKKSRNDLIFNESVHNSIISEGSQYNINQKSFEIKNEKKNKLNSCNNMPSVNNTINLNNSKEDTSSGVLKKNTAKLSKVKYGSVINIKNKLKRKPNKNFKTSIQMKYNAKYTNLSKFLKYNSDFKNIKSKLKDSIILRPEEMEIQRKKKSNFKVIKKISNNKLANDDLKSDRMNKTSIKSRNIKIINKSLNTINLGYLNKDEIFKRNNSNIDKKNINISEISEKNKPNKIPKNIENETEKTLKTTTKTTNKSNNVEIPKNNLFNLFSKNEIQSKGTTQFEEKYRTMVQKPNIYDSLDDEELEDQEDGFIYLDPNSNFVLIFDGILLFISMISFIVIPFYLASTHDFCRKKKFTLISAFNITTEFLYALDLFLGFFRAYYNWEEQLICRHRSIMKKYLAGWFIFDFISAFPIYIFNKLSEPFCNEHIFKTTYYNIILENLSYILICNRLFKLVKVLYNNQAIKVLLNKISDRLKMIFTSLLIISALNYSACLYIFIARNSYPNWILNTGLGTHNFFHIYICSIYIIIMALTTVGYGDITCYSFHERIYQLLLLIIGIMAYSYAVSSVSNYIQKINEKSADLQNKKSILDEIKMNNPNMPEELYERIMKFLTYKNKHEKKFKSLIFDSLPVTLKNDLISEMYKPIIKKFIFFKNFQNKDFIVRVILAFKAVIADKNDILVNEGDLLEDIMFIKKGVLSVELPINITNPQKNIDRYLNGPLLKEKIEPKFDKKLTDLDNWFNNNNIKSLLNRSNSNKNNNSMKDTQNNHSSTIIGASHEASKIFSTLAGKKSLKDKNKIPDEIRYVKILGIRNNEHFGDVLMFLEKRSPLRLRVRTKKCELFFLKKIDAIKISNDHPTIWRSINKKSLYNFEQIKKCIVKIVEIYCSVKRLESISEKESLFEDLIEETEKEQKKSKKLKENNFNKKSNLSEIKDFNITRSKSLNNKKDNYFEKIFKENYQECKINNKKSHSLKNFQKKNYDLNEINSQTFGNNNKISSKKKARKIFSIKNKNLRKYKSEQFKIKKLASKKISVNNNSYRPKINQKKLMNGANNKVNLIPIKKEQKNSHQKNTKSSVTHTLKFSNNSSSINSSMENNSIKKNLISKLNSPSSKTIKLEDSYSSHFFRRENNDDKGELIDNEEDESSEIIVNKEISTSEEINVQKDNTLFSKKYKQSFLNELNREINNELIDNNIEYKNTKIKLLLSSFIKENLLDLNNNINNNNINNTNINNNENNNINNSIILSHREKKFKDLSINQNISIIIESSYENCNLISKEKLINNKILQEKLKIFLSNDTVNNMSLNTGKFKHAASLLSNYKETKFQSSMYNSPINIKKKIYSRQSASFLNFASLQKNYITIRHNPLIRSSSLNEDYIQKNKKNKIKFNNDIINNINNDILTNGKSPKANKKEYFKRMSSSIGKETVTLGSNLKLGNETPHKKRLNKRSVIQGPQNNIKLKKNNDSSMLLSQIDLNIEKTNQNLNNPNEFYSNYFNYLLEEKIIGKNNRIHYSEFFGPKDELELKKEKPIKRGNTLRRIISNKKI